MNWHALGSPATLLQPLGWMLIHFLWQGSALAILLYAAIAGLKSASANVRYLSGCFALFLMGIAPLLTFRYEVELSRMSTIESISKEAQRAIRPLANSDDSRHPVIAPVFISRGPAPVRFVAPKSWVDRIIVVCRELDCWSIHTFNEAVRNLDSRATVEVVTS
jgi:hypothetical protein